MSNEKLKLESQFSQFRNSPAGTLAVNRMLYERGENPESAEAPAAQDSIGIVSGILDNLNKGGTAPPSISAASAPAQPAVVAPAQSQPQASGFIPAMGRAGISAIGAYTDRLASERENTQQPGFLRTQMEGISGDIANIGKAIISPVYAPAGGYDTSIRHAPLQNLTYGVTTPSEKVALQQLFGADATGLMPELARLATSNGISQDQQMATYKAALGGDPSARSKIDEMLNFVRQMKTSPDFDPVSTPQLELRQ